MENSLKSTLFSFTNSGGALVSALLIFYLIKPYFVWNDVLNSPQVSSILTLLLGVLFFRQREHGENFLTILLSLFIAITVSYTTINHYNIVFSLSFLPVCFLPFAKEQFTKDVYNNFLNIYAIVMAVSLTVWMLAWAGAMPSIGNIAPLNSLKSYNYLVYPLLVMPPGNFRFCSVFDEPGVVGTISGLILCIQKFDLKDRRNLIVLISGICSFSFFFYVLISAYFLFYFIFVKKSAKNTILYAAFIAIVFYTITSVDVLNEILGSRFEWDTSSGTFSGDSRYSEKAMDMLDSIVGTDEFWWGISDKQSYRDLVSGSSTFLNVLILNGIVFSVSYLIFWILYGLKVRNSLGLFLLFIVAFVACVYQRPDLFCGYYIFLWACLARVKDNDLAIQS